MTDIAILGKIGKVVHFKENQMVFMQNDPGDTMYFTLKGMFGVYINSFTDFPARVAGIDPGLTFGEMSLIDGWPRSATIISEEESAALRIDKSHFGEFIENCPNAAFGILKDLARRAVSTTEKVRSAGKFVPEIPEWLLDPKPADTKAVLSNMTLLSQRLRELNELMGIEEKADIEIKKDSGITSLLPPGHRPLNLSASRCDYSRYLSKKKYVCPYCSKQFEDRVPIFSRLCKQDETPDGRVIHRDFDILRYINVVCPNCNYCDTYQEFTGTPKHPDAVVKGNQFVNSEGFSGYAGDTVRSIDEAIVSHYLSLHCLKQVKGSPLRQAKAWQRLYWLYRDCGDSQKARDSAENSIQCYTDYCEASKNKLTTVDVMTINILLGEMSVAIGKVQEGRQYFVENTRIGKMLRGNELVQKSLKRAGMLKELL